MFVYLIKYPPSHSVIVLCTKMDNFYSINTFWWFYGCSSFLSYLYNPHWDIFLFCKIISEASSECTYRAGLSIYKMSRISYIQHGWYLPADTLKTPSDGIRHLHHINFNHLRLYQLCTRGKHSPRMASWPVPSPSLPEQFEARDRGIQAWASKQTR